MGTARWLAVILVMIGASSYGLLSPIVKTAYNAGWANEQVTSTQITMGAAIMWLLVLVQKKAWSNPFKGPWIRLALIGILGVSLCTLLFNAALSELDASVALILLFQFTWVTIMMEAIANRAWPNRNRWIAVGLIMLGTLFSVEVFQADWSRFTVKGLVLGLGAAAAYSFFLFMAGRLNTTLHPLMKSAVMVTAALPLLYLLFPPVFFFQSGGFSLVLWGLLLGSLGQVIPSITFMIGIPRIGSSLAAMLGAMELPVGIVASLFILKETVHIGQWFGMLFILAGIVLAEKRNFLTRPVR